MNLVCTFCTQCSAKTQTRAATMAGPRDGAIMLSMVTLYAVDVQPCVSCVQQVARLSFVLNKSKYLEGKGKKV